MNIETVPDLAEQIADWLGIYGGCKSDGDTGCTYEENIFCCRQGFVSAIEERIRKSVENDALLSTLTNKI